jgi:hypothetical protein
MMERAPAGAAIPHDDGTAMYRQQGMAAIFALRLGSWPTETCQWPQGAMEAGLPTHRMVTSAVTAPGTIA